MTAKTLEKAPVTLGGFVHPLCESIYSVDEIATSLPASVTIFPNGDLGGHYEQINPGGKNAARFHPHVLCVYTSLVTESFQREWKHVAILCRKTNLFILIYLLIYSKWNRSSLTTLEKKLPNVYVITTDGFTVDSLRKSCARCIQ